VPFYKYHSVLGGFAAFKNHVSLAFVSCFKVNTAKCLKKRLHNRKKTIQIKFDQKVPTTAINQILKAKAKMNEAKRAIKQIYNLPVNFAKTFSSGAVAHRYQPLS